MAASEAVLDAKRHFLGQAQGDLVRQSGGLAEVDQVLEREGQSNRLAKLNGNVLLWLVDVGVLADGDGTVSNVTRAGELDAFL